MPTVTTSVQKQQLEQGRYSVLLRAMGMAQRKLAEQRSYYHYDEENFIEMDGYLHFTLVGQTPPPHAL